MIFSKVGDVYNEDTLRRDFMALWNTNRFDDIKLETEKGERGGVVVTLRGDRAARDSRHQI